MSSDMGSLPIQKLAMSQPEGG